MTAEVGIAVRRAAPADRPAVLALLATALGWQEHEDLAGFFAWKHHLNPFGESPAWVACDGERVVGFRTFVRWEFEDATGRAVRAVRAVDTATDPEFQGRGVFRALTLAAVDELSREGVDFVFNTPNAKSRPGYLSMGWRNIGRLPTVVRVAGLRGIVRMAQSRVAADRGPVPVAAGAPAADVLADPRVATLLDALPPATGIRTRRSVTQLQWRYGYAPLGYRAVAVDDDPAAGVAVFRVRRRGRAREAALCELLVPGGARDATHISRALCRGVRAAGADYVIGLGGAARPPGFVPLPRQGPQLTWRALATCSPAPALGDWQLSLGDVELL